MRTPLAILALTFTQALTAAASPAADADTHAKRAPLPLDTLAKNKGKLYFGSSIRGDWFADPKYAAIETREFKAVTPDNVMTMPHIQWQQGVWTWDGADAVMAQARKQGALVRGHTFCWHLFTPNWMETMTDPATLKAALHNHMQAVFSRYSGQFYAFDVVNEAIADDGTWSNSVYYRVLGEEYIGIALDMAHALAPHVKLYVNDWGIEGGNPKKAAAFLAMVKKLVAQKKPLHGVGFQSHFNAGNVPPGYAATMRTYTDMGLDVAVTELNIRVPADAQGIASPASLQQQAKDYATVVKACLGNPKCPGITVWGWDDKHLWMPEGYPGMGAAELADANYNWKPCYWSTVAALGG